ncbi:DoxX family protein [Polaribacter ponticola]|uniref:DoxX family protein n=1 Tax=Polaribacter ponticola TaxID=2978475 RepID=A0ABT5S665_9FLAO|nr:DoxX family protein [Polaribacter sp. MSW5]MDD7913110.1 DoxX family protein [Polaribacter sp. MSW5]
MLQTLFYKFSGAQESIELFTKIAGDREVYMRIGTGILEFIASIMLFSKLNSWFGAFLTIGLMGGGVFSHLTKLGIEHNNDGGLLFGSAVLILIIGLIVLFKERKNIPIVGNRL